MWFGKVKVTNSNFNWLELVLIDINHLNKTIIIELFWLELTVVDFSQFSLVMADCE